MTRDVSNGSNPQIGWVVVDEHGKTIISTYTKGYAELLCQQLRIPRCQVKPFYFKDKVKSDVSS